MKALILCDGSEASLRCVEVACASSAPPPSATTTSLTLLHLWDGPAKASDGHAGVPASLLSRNSSAGHAQTAAADAASVHPEDAAAAPHAASMACADVLTATLQAVHTNKYVKGRAHYTVETMGAAVAAGEDAEAVQALHHLRSTMHSAGEAEEEEGKMPVSTTPPSQQQQQQQQLLFSANSAVSSAAPAPAAATNTGDEVDGHRKSKMSAVVRQTAVSAARHHVDAVLLGVGQHQEGKVCRLGATAEDALRYLRWAYPLIFVKRDGVKWRPLPPGSAATTTPIRFTIVVPIVDVSAPTAEGDLLSLQTKTAIEAAVQHVQQHCVRVSAAGSAPVTVVDSVGFLVIAPSFLSSEDEKDEKGDNATSAPLRNASPALEACRAYLTSTLPPPPTPAAEASLAEQAKVEAVPSPADELTPQNLNREFENAGETITASAGGSPGSRVVVCALKASKKHARVTLQNAEVALPQVVKLVSAAKPDVLVLPSSLVSEALQRTLLSLSRPHCVTLPC